MRIERQIPLGPLNTFGIKAAARTMIRIASESDLIQVLQHDSLAGQPKRLLGGGSNTILTRDVSELLLKIEIKGRAVALEERQAWIIEAGAGEQWPDLVQWSLDQGIPGLENLAMIPGTVGAAPVQNIGAYGVELKDRFLSLDAVDLETGRRFSLDGPACCFAYRDSIFKQRLAGKAVITRVRLRLPKPWRPVIDYPDLQHRCDASGQSGPDARQVFEWVCNLRRTKLPDPIILGNAGSFFKNPVVAADRHTALRNQAPDIAAFPMSDGTVKLSAAWLIEQCGWKGKRVGNVGVYEKQALILVNHGGATGAEVMALAAAIRKSVQDRFDISLEIEPTVL